MTLLAEYVRVSPQLPCPICLKPDWCLVARDGQSAICQRIESELPWKRAGYLHELTETIDVPQTAIEVSPKLETGVVTELAEYWCRHTDREQRLRSLAVALGVEYWALNALQTGWRGDCYSSPMVDGELRIVGVRFRSTNGRKWSLKGGREGLFVPKSFGIRPLVFVAEGASDCAALLSAGLAAVGRPNRCVAWDTTIEVLERCEAEDVVLVSDSDPDGMRDTKQLAAILADKFSRVRSIVPTAHKDAREVVAAGFGSNEIFDCLEYHSSECWKWL